MNTTTSRPARTRAGSSWTLSLYYSVYYSLYCSLYYSLYYQDDLREQEPVVRGLQETLVEFVRSDPALCGRRKAVPVWSGANVPYYLLLAFGVASLAVGAQQMLALVKST